MCMQLSEVELEVARARGRSLRWPASGLLPSRYSPLLGVKAFWAQLGYTVPCSSDQGLLMLRALASNHS